MCALIDFHALDDVLRHTNKNKGRAVTTMLNDEEWVKWSDREISQ